MHVIGHVRAEPGGIVAAAVVRAALVQVAVVQCTAVGQVLGVEIVV